MGREQGSIFLEGETAGQPAERGGRTLCPEQRMEWSLGADCAGCVRSETGEKR